MTEIDGVDTELLKALRVIRGDNDKKKDAGSAANSLLSKAIVTAIESQGTATTTQNAELLDAIKEQNMLLDGLTELLRKKALESPPKTTVVVVNKEPAQSVASTVAAAAADNETTDDNKIIDEPEIAAALAAADAADKTEQAKTVKKAAAGAAYVAPAKKPKPEPIKPRVITGPWAFVESDVALKRRNRVVKSTGQFKMLPKDTKKEDIPDDAFTPISNDDILKKEDSLFGKVASNDTSDVLVGDSFGRYWDRMRNPVDQYGKLKAPKWSTLDKKKSIRTYLPKLAIGGETQIKLKSGIYYLTIKYENNYATKQDDSKEVEAALIVGEIAFDCRGFVLAPGADWSKLFGGQKQLEPPLAGGGKLKWYSSKVSEPWKNGDTLKFKIDTHTNTLGYTIQGAGEKEVRTGWMFKNVFAFTNNRTYSDYMQVLSYCGGSSSNTLTNSKFDSVKFTLVETRRTQSVLNLDSPNITEELEDTSAEATEADASPLN